jgi:hypothetical protein
MNEHLLWQTEPDGVLAAEIGELRLVVQPPVREFVRFMVLRRNSDGRRPALLCSGHEIDVRAAMDAAERKADTCSSPRVRTRTHR